MTIKQLNRMNRAELLELIHDEYCHRIEKKYAPYHDKSTLVDIAFAELNFVCQIYY